MTIIWRGGWDMIDKIEYNSGVIRITNERTLEMWKKTGRYDEMISRGLVFNRGCGRFREFKCECSKCKKYGNNRKDKKYPSVIKNDIWIS